MGKKKSKQTRNGAVKRKRLEVRREVLRNLSVEETQQVAGGTLGALVQTTNLTNVLLLGACRASQ